MSSDPITLEALAFFRRPEGTALLERAAELGGDELAAQQLLRATYPPHLCRAALALAQLRRAAREKFSLADRMFFDREGLEMATREKLSQYRASRFHGCETLMDLCCGIGGDLLGLAAQFRVQAVEADRLRLEMARMNLEAAGLRAAFIQADVRSIRPRADALFLDPSRRFQGRRVRAAEDYSPPLSFAEELRRQVPALAIKVSPAIDERQLPANCEVEFLSADQQCREGVLYFGRLATVSRRATLLPGPHTLEAAAGPPAPIGPPGAFLYDPDPAVVRAHLIDELARHLYAWKLDPHIAYLSGETCRPTPFAKVYRVLNCQPFHLKRLRRFLSQEGFYPCEIKKRRFPVEPREMRQLLGLSTGRQPVTLVLTRIAERPVAAICVRVENG